MWHKHKKVTIILVVNLTVFVIRAVCDTAACQLILNVLMVKILWTSKDSL